MVHHAFVCLIACTAALVGGDEIERADISDLVRQHFPIGSDGGLALLVIKDEEIVHSKGYGTVFGKTPVTSQTRMSLGFDQQAICGDVCGDSDR